MQCQPQRLEVQKRAYNREGREEKITCNASGRRTQTLPLRNSVEERGGEYASRAGVTKLASERKSRDRTLAPCGDSQSAIDYSGGSHGLNQFETQQLLYKGSLYVKNTCGIG